MRKIMYMDKRSGKEMLTHLRPFYYLPFIWFVNLFNGRRYHIYGLCSKYL